MTDVHTVANEAVNFFTTKKRGDETIVVCKDGTPDWVRDLVYEAHGGLLPNDRKYELVMHALEAINEGATEDDAGEFADGAVDVYTSDRYAWLAAGGGDYVDQAADEFGHEAVYDGGVVGAIGMGQYVEANEVFFTVYRLLEKVVEEREEDDDDNEL